jgi:hypothetical protein
LNRKRVNVTRKNKEELILKAKCTDKDYQEIFNDNTTPLRPLIHFFKFLLPKPKTFTHQPNFITRSKLVLSIPYTVVYDIEEYPVLYYTSEEGCVVRVDNPSQEVIKRKLTYTARKDMDLMVVIKRPLVSDVVTNHATLLNTKQVKDLLDNPSQGVVLFQRYVKGKGSKACLNRIVWNSVSPCTGYMLSNKVCLCIKW